MAAKDPELLVLMFAQLRGTCDAASTATGTRLPARAVEDQVRSLVDRALVEARPSGMLRLTAEGKGRLEELSRKERQTLDGAALDLLYDDFTALNDEVKGLVRCWQLRDDQTPNDHSDPDYDAEVVRRLHQVSKTAAPWFSDLVTAVPRLCHYPVRLDAALHRVDEGDPAFVARPLLDSYHTVWFELHEELIRLTGRSRVDEAAAGRAT